MAVSAGMALLSTATAAASGTLMTAAWMGALGGTLLGHFLVTTAIGAAINALSPKPKAGGSQGYNVTQTSSVADHQIVYGKVRVAGVRVFDAVTGANNEYLHRVVAFTGHEIESFDEIYLNDAKVTEIDGSGNIVSVLLADGTTSSRYNGFLRIKTHTGAVDQVADTDLVSEVDNWTADHRLQEISYAYLRFKYDSNAYPNGIPEITVTIKGKKVYDPRTTLTAWSDNPALCIRDYLTSSYGLQETSDAIDDTLVTTAADICDQTNTLSGNTRFTCNGNITTGGTPYDILHNILSSMGGLLWYSQGKWRMKPAYWTTPEVSFNEDDLRGSISLNTRHSRRDNYNTVNGTFRGEESNWQTTDFPPVTNVDFLVADNNLESTIDIPLAFTDNSEEARRLARINLERNRQQLTIQTTFGLRGFQIQVGDNILLNNSRFGWVNKAFEVISWTFGVTNDYDLQVQVTLREITESVFDEIDDGVVYERDNTALPNLFEIGPPGITVSSDLKIINQQVAGILVIELTGGQAGFFYEHEVEYKLSSDTSWIALGKSTSSRYEIPFISDGYYDVRARSISVLGVKSPYSSVLNWYASPFSAPPSNVSNFAGNTVGNTLHLTWDAVPDLDLSHYKIRYASAISGASYQNAVDVVDKVSRPAVSVTVPAKTGTYFIKAVDKLGNVSLQPTSFVVVTDISSVENLNLITTLTEDPDFLGAKTNTAKIVDGASTYITLDTATLFDDFLGLFDDATGLFDSGGGSIAAYGTYEFTDYVDLGAKYTSRVSIAMALSFIDYVNTFDSASGLFDSHLGDFDGDPTQYDVTSAKAQVAYTDDDPAGTPVWSDWQNIIVSDISARAIKFRVILATSDPGVAPAITSLSASVDMPDRTESESDISFTGSYSATFPSAFRAAPALGISVTMADGDRYVISSKTATGFTITIYTGASVSTNPVTLDYVARGYGKVI